MSTGVFRRPFFRTPAPVQVGLETLSSGLIPITGAASITEADDTLSAAATIGASQSGVSRLSRHEGGDNWESEYTRIAGGWSYGRVMDVLSIVQRLKGKLEEEAQPPPPAPPEPRIDAGPTAAKIKAQTKALEREAAELEAKVAAVAAERTAKLEKIAALEVKLERMAEAAWAREAAEADEEDAIVALLMAA